MKELALLALDSAKVKGASYADIRIGGTKSELIEIKNGKVVSVKRESSYGFGVRVISDGGWGFASSADVTKPEIEDATALAVRIAKASAKLKSKDVILAPEGKHIDTWKTPFEIDPFTVSLEEKIGLLLSIDQILRSVKGVKVAESTMQFWDEDCLFANSEGSLIEQRILQSGAGYSATAVNETEVQTRSYPNSFGGQYESCGYELISRFGLKENALRIGEEAVALLSAKQCEQKVTALILDGTQLSLQIHESCGHPTELDRVLGSEANYAGTSFMTLDKLGKLKYGSEIVNIVADATTPRGLGSFAYDDEGVPGKRNDLIKNGMFVGYMTSRETAQAINQRSNGTMRADGWHNIPLVRMTCINLLPGTWTLDDLIADTDDGIYMVTNRSWSIDDKRHNFQFGTEIGWEIKNGKLGAMVKNPTYTGLTTEFWNSCDAICNKDHWEIWGTPTCGKGQPPQTARTAQGTAPARFRKTRVGVAY
ncbi:MAG: TldD/PmbA family protein [Candidatus Eisenbacteria bacterium]|nr:TldD/PmbA family protein [Candidatus Eisenbacteria bacterium]